MKTQSIQSPPPHSLFQTFERVVGSSQKEIVISTIFSAAITWYLIDLGLHPIISVFVSIGLVASAVNVIHFISKQRFPEKVEVPLQKEPNEGISIDPNTFTDETKVIQMLMENILQEKETEGIFRVSGSEKQVQRSVSKSNLNKKKNFTRLKSTLKFSHKREHNFSKISEFFQNQDINTLTNTLKRLLKQRDSLLLDKVKQQILEFEEFSVGTIKSLLEQLEPQDLAVLSILLHGLSEIAQCEEKNKMSAGNLATCMGPNFITLSEGTKGFDEANKINSFVTYLIQHAAVIFAPPKQISP